MTERLTNQLIKFFKDRAAHGDPMALITVLSTEGSTYSKAGSQMLVDARSEFQGMLSGGCLEGDLAERAQKVINENAAQQITYDLRGDDDVFGLGVGCEGMLQILIQPLDANAGYEPLSTVLSDLEQADTTELPLLDGTQRLGVAVLRAPLRLLILGAGKDAEPLVVFAAELGWQVSVCDHRPAAIGSFHDSVAENVACIAVADLPNHVDLDRFDAVIVMSHNLAADRQYLASLAESTVEFVGLLGPPHRRDRLLDELGPVADQLRARLHGPVGQRVGGRGPAAIALEIVAELQSHFWQGD